MRKHFVYVAFHSFCIFKCQINTDPMKSALGYLAVVVPPDIIDYETSHDMVVDEGQNVTLTCSAVGLPEPTIEWRREGKKPLMSIGSEESLYILLICLNHQLTTQSKRTKKPNTPKIAIENQKNFCLHSNLFYLRWFNFGSGFPIK